MAFYLSPLVAVNEYDATTTIPAVATSIGVIVLRDTYKGPELKTQFISSVNDLITIFGKPTNTPSCYQDILSATGYLKYGSMLYATRALGASATFAEVDIDIDPDTNSAVTSASTVLTLEQMRIRTQDAGGDVDDWGSESTGAAGLFMRVVATSRGAWGNNIRIAMCGKDTYATISALVDADGIDSNSTEVWSTSAALGSIDSPIEDDQSFILLVQTVDQGLSTVEPAGGPSAGISNWVTQEYFNVSLNPDAIDDTGRKRYVTTMVNETSNLIRISLNSAQYDITTDISNLNTPNWISLVSGSDVAATDGDIQTALDLYQNPEEIDVNVFIDSNKSDTIKSYMVDICVDRKDAMAILDVPMAMVLANRGDETEDLRVYVRSTLGINSSYAALYGNWIEIYDKWNGKYRWVPTSGHVAGLFANNDYVAEPWFAPAGPNRALITSVRRLAWNPSLGQRNILYKNGINPIVSLAGMGKLVYGQKTLLDKESAFNRINVRRLFMVLEKAISTAARYFLFEPNDDISRLLLINMIDPFLRDVKARRGVYDYMIVCDESNNTGERINRGELWCDIYIKPTRAAEFIVLNFVATKTGASFSEVAGITG